MATETRTVDASAAPKWVIMVGSSTLSHNPHAGEIVGKLAKLTGARVVIPSEVLCQTVSGYVHDKATMDDYAKTQGKKAGVSGGTRDVLDRIGAIQEINNTSGRYAQFVPPVVSKIYNEVTGSPESTYFDAVKAVMADKLSNRALLDEWENYRGTRVPQSGINPRKELAEYCNGKHLSPDLRDGLFLVLDYTYGIANNHGAHKRGGDRPLYFDKVDIDPKNIDLAGALNAFQAAFNSGAAGMFGYKGDKLADARKAMEEAALLHQAETLSAQPNTRVVVISEDMTVLNAVLKPLEDRDDRKVIGLNSKELAKLGLAINESLGANAAKMGFEGKALERVMTAPERVGAGGKFSLPADRKGRDVVVGELVQSAGIGAQRG